MTARRAASRARLLSLVAVPRRSAAARALLLSVVAASSLACRTGGGAGGASTATGIVVEERVVVVPLDGGREARLGASLAKPDALVVRGPGVVVVPGGGDVSRAGTRAGDGARAYPAPVDVAARLSEALAGRGFLALSYDKRTCDPRDDARCRKNPVADVDAQGPAALAKDVDAACALLRAERGVDGRIVLWAHGQAAAVALSSSCAREAAAVVLVAPIPRDVDDVMVDAMEARAADLKAAAKQAKDPAEKARLDDAALDLRNKAASQKRTFESMKKGLFEKTARVQGATLAFWQSWIDLTKKTPALVEGVDAPVIVVLAAKDAQYAAADRDRIRALGKTAGARLVELDRADHHLLVDGKLDARALEPVLDAVEDALAGRGAS